MISTNRPQTIIAVSDKVTYLYVVVPSSLFITDFPICHWYTPAMGLVEIFLRSLIAEIRRLQLSFDA